MADQKLRNPEVSKLAQILIHEMERVIQASSLGPADAALILLAAAHGRGKMAGWSNEALVQRAAHVWDACSRSNEAKRTSIDFNVSDEANRFFPELQRIPR